MEYLYVKAFHIVAMVTWFAGLFYIVRIFIYHTEAGLKKSPDKEILQNQLDIMGGRLWYIITWPGMLLTVLSGLGLILMNPEIMKQGWLHIKLTFIFLLIGYHLYSGGILKKLKNRSSNISSQKLRMLNEMPTIILFAVVFLAVLKSGLSLLYAFAGLLILMILLMVGVKAYKKTREAK